MHREKQKFCRKKPSDPPKNSSRKAEFQNFPCSALQTQSHGNKKIRREKQSFRTSNAVPLQTQSHGNPKMRTRPESVSLVSRNYDSRRARPTRSPRLVSSGWKTHGRPCPPQQVQLQSSSVSRLVSRASFRLTSQNRLVNPLWLWKHASAVRIWPSRKMPVARVAPTTANTLQTHRHIPRKAPKCTI